MDTSTSPTPTLVAVGHSNSSDAFQGGREAAQTAKAQFAQHSADLVVVLGPANAHFQDFIEGVRLVTGEQGLVGIPTHQILTNATVSPNGNLVLLLRSDTIYFSVASTDLAPPAFSPAFTELLTQHRHNRGNIRQQFEHYGLVLVDNVSPAEKKLLIQEATIETGLDSLIVSITPSPSLSVPLICNDTVHHSGLVGIECLSTQAFGIGTVNIGSFEHKPQLYVEAIKSAVREAAEEMASPPAAAFLLFDFHLEAQEIKQIQTLFSQDESVLAKLPVVGLSTASHAVKYPHRAGTVHKETIVAVLLPS